MKKKIYSLLLDNSGKARIVTTQAYARQLAKKDPSLQILQFLNEEDAEEFAKKYQGSEIGNRKLIINKEEHRQQILQLIKKKTQNTSEGLSVSLKCSDYYVIPQLTGFPRIYRQKTSILRAGYELSQARVYRSFELDKMIDDLFQEQSTKPQLTHIDIEKLKTPVQENVPKQIETRVVEEVKQSIEVQEQRKINLTFEEIQAVVHKIIENNSHEYKWFKILDTLPINSLESNCTYNLFFDGSTSFKYNSWESACAYVLKNENMKYCYKMGSYLGSIRSNGAEFTGLLFGLTSSLLMGTRKLQVLGDSQLIIYIMNKKYRVHDPTLSKIYKIAVQLVQYFDEIKFVHIPREMNQDADKIAREKREKFGEVLKEKQSKNL